MSRPEISLGWSFCGRVLSIIQFLLDDLDGGFVTGVVRVGFSAAYDTVNHRAIS